MADLKHHKLVSILVAITVSHLFALTPADASYSLFRMLRTWHGSGDPVISSDFHPRSTGPYQAPPVTAYIGTTLPAPRFTAQSSFIIDTHRYSACLPGTCMPGYPESKAWYSYRNLRGSFRPNNPYGATTAVTVRFPTTMGNAGPPLGTGMVVTPTTAFDGRYDFSRAGSIMVTPGPNRFGGTMQFFYGPNHRYYQLITASSPYISKAYGSGQPPVSTYHESRVGEFVIGRRMDRYRMTSGGQYRETVGTTPGGGPEYYVQKLVRISTIVPFTTGMITAWNPVGDTTTVHTLTGYDNRTYAGSYGVISMVRPRLVHSYIAPHDPNQPIRKVKSSLRTWQMDFDFSYVFECGDCDGVGDAIDNCSETANPGQDDTDGDSCGNLCDADYDQNGTVGFPDFGLFAKNFSTTNELYQHTEPIPGGTVGFTDFGFFAANFSTTPGPSGPTEGTIACP